QGNHAEVGINWMGSYGSTVDAPTGYHPHLTSSQMLNNSAACGGTPTTSTNFLGFVADPNYTNWTAYFGDYYLPGRPQEGWALEIMGHKLEAYTPTAQGTGTDSIVGLTGANISYTTTATGVSSTWEGVFDSVKITQVTSLDTGALFFTVNVTLTNLSAFPRDSVYYMRSIDPDNDVTMSGGSFTTSNYIDRQMPGGSDSLVVISTKGTIYPAAQLALATKDPRATGFIIDVGLEPADTVRLADIYSHSLPYLYHAGDSSIDDVGIGLVFNIGHLASVDSAGDSVLRTSAPRHPANSSSFKLIYSFNTGLTTTFLTDTTHNVPLMASNNATATGERISIFPNPSAGDFQVVGLSAGDKLEVYDLSGRLVMYDITYLPSNRATRVLSGIPRGSYILVVKQDDGSIAYRQRIIKN
ncbi:MAG: T9SS C-terminal target domain-containing protein, partial [Chitinophagia bacterium]|nr:T9SS C-terminal target domain-containing protein [Chitinophagia bacterium]